MSIDRVERFILRHGTARKQLRQLLLCCIINSILFAAINVQQRILFLLFLLCAGESMYAMDKRV